MSKGEPITKPENGCGGPSVVSHLEDLLDAVYDQLMNPDAVAEEEAEAHKGYARGLVTAIAVLQNPSFPNVAPVRAAAVARYEARQAEEEEDEESDIASDGVE